MHCVFAGNDRDSENSTKYLSGGFLSLSLSLSLLLPLTPHPPFPFLFTITFSSEMSTAGVHTDTQRRALTENAHHRPLKTLNRSPGMHLHKMPFPLSIPRLCHPRRPDREASSPISCLAAATGLPCRAKVGYQSDISLQSLDIKEIFNSNGWISKRYFTPMV